MKIVIDIPENMYQRIAVAPRCASGLDAFKDRDMFVKAIQEGTPLPKGYGRIIDESKITQVYYREEKAEQGAINFRGIVVDRTDAPTIIEADTESEEVG